MPSHTSSAGFPVLVVVAAEDLFSSESDWLQQISQVAQEATAYPSGSIALQLRPTIAEVDSNGRSADQRLDCLERIRRVLARIDPQRRLPIYASRRASWLVDTNWRWHLPESYLKLPMPMDTENSQRQWSASVHDTEAARLAEEAGARLLLFAPVFAPSWKPATAAGLQGLHEVVSATRRPVLALGGVTPSRVATCLETGAAGVAVASSIMLATEPDLVLRIYADLLALRRSVLPR